ncbi:MAG: hypothetical protein KGR48_05195 [Alphaproteobacteria bacterium]|nr:hypothetical protein [Alphaproteobacteria bacterium]MDE2351560.1 hypothetical protein [Alphaproteobacteria bacterium]
MGHEGFWPTVGREKPGEKKVVIIRTTDAVAREFGGRCSPGEMSREARRILVRVIREHNRGRMTVLAGETKAAAVWVSEIFFGCAEVR